MKRGFVITLIAVLSIFALLSAYDAAYFYWQSAVVTSPADLARVRAGFWASVFLFFIEFTAAVLALCLALSRKRRVKRGFPI